MTPFSGQRDPSGSSPLRMRVSPGVLQTPVASDSRGYTVVEVPKYWIYEVRRCG